MYILYENKENIWCFKDADADARILIVENMAVANLFVEKSIGNKI